MRPTARIASVLAAFALAVAVPNAAHAARAYVVESDFSSGSFSTVNTVTRALACNAGSVHSDARVRWYNGQVFIINRFGADNIQVLDGVTSAFVRQFSVGNGSNPYDIAFASPTRAYVCRYASSDLWIVDPLTGAHTGTVSLAALADADGKPEPDRMIMVGPLLFVSLQRVDQNGGFLPTDSSLVAVVDTRTDALVDCDAAAPGVQGILLPRVNPVTPFVFDAPRTRLYLGCVGRYNETDGGIVALDPAALTAQGVVATEAALGGDVLDIAWRDDDRAYAIVGDAAFNTSLIRWSLPAAAVVDTLYSPGGFSLADMEITPDGSEVWACNSSFGSPGVRVFSTATGLQVAGPLFCTLPPQGIAFDQATGQVAGVSPDRPGLALAPPVPNPASGTVTFRLGSAGAGDVRVEVSDIAGRRVRGWTESSAGVRTLTWDLRDGQGRRVAPGVYLVSVRSGEASATRRVLVVQ